MRIRDKKTGKTFDFDEDSIDSLVRVLTKRVRDSKIEELTASEVRSHDGWPDYCEWAEKHCEHFFGLIDEGGNKKEDVCDAFTAVIDQAQKIAIGHAGLMKDKEVEVLTAAFMLMGMLFDVVTHNPMYDTPQLQAQMREHLREFLTRPSGGYRIDTGGRG